MRNVLAFVPCLLLLSGCAASFNAVKRRLDRKTDTVIITFYDSELMNAEAISTFLEFKLDNPYDMKEFRKFISLVPGNGTQCQGAGEMVFKGDGDQLAHASFSLENRCLIIRGSDTDGVFIRRMKRKGKSNLEKWRLEAANQESQR